MSWPRWVRSRASRFEAVSDRTFLIHLGGKLEMRSRVPLKTRDDLSMAYTPGVARVSRAIASDPESIWNLTIKRNTVAVVSDGTAVLGLGDIGPGGALPVMEGKAILFKEFAGVDAVPLCLDTKDAEEIILIVKAVAPVFGGINLEDISAPRCFEIERRLREMLDIPVFHDDQHGTAIVTLAALMNALKVVGKRLDAIKVVITGVGAAGVAVTKTLLAAGVRDIVGCDRLGAVYRDRPGLSGVKREYAELTNPRDVRGSADEALAGADVFIGVSQPGAISVEGVARMADRAIVFAMANPTPEVAPELIEEMVEVVATGARTTRTRSTTCSRFRASSAARLMSARARSTGDGGRRRPRDRGDDPRRRAVRRLYRAERVQPRGRSGRRRRGGPGGRRDGRRAQASRARQRLSACSPGPCPRLRPQSHGSSCAGGSAGAGGVPFVAEARTRAGARSRTGADGAGEQDERVGGGEHDRCCERDLPGRDVADGEADGHHERCRGGEHGGDVHVPRIGESAANGAARPTASASRSAMPWRTGGPRRARQRADGGERHAPERVAQREPQQASRRAWSEPQRAGRRYRTRESPRRMRSATSSCPRPTRPMPRTLPASAGSGAPAMPTRRPTVSSFSPCRVAHRPYQMSAVRAMEDACGVAIDAGPLRDLRRLIYFAEWIESHSLHVYMLHAPDFLGYTSAIEMARDHREIVEQGLQMKKTGNALMSVVGGREIHPINIRVGGFYRAPTRPSCARSSTRSSARERRALATVRWTAALPFPDVRREPELVALAEPAAYPIDLGRIVSDRGLDIAPAAFVGHVVEEHVEHSNALHARHPRARQLPHRPARRYSLASQALWPLGARRCARGRARAGLPQPVPEHRRPQRRARAGLRRGARDHRRATRSRTARRSRCIRAARVGHGATEAPRGMLYHRYEIDDDGTILSATIIPPTSQNQRPIEEDLRAVVEQHLDLPDEQLRLRCEQAIRNHDPCISCATHFLDLTIERG